MFRKNIIIKLFNSNIKNKFLVTFLVLSLLPLVSIAVFTYTYSFGTVKKEYLDMTNKNLEQISENLDYSLRELDMVSLMALNDRNIQDLLDRSSEKDYTLSIRDRESMEQFLTNLNILREDISGLYIISGRNTFYHSLYEVGTMGDTDYSEKEWYQKILKGDGARVLFGTHKPYIGRNNDKLVFSLARVIKDVRTGRKLGIIMIDTNFKLISDLCGKTLDSSGWVDIIDEEGKVVFSPEQDKIGDKLVLDRNTSDEIIDKISGDRILKMDGRDVFVNYLTSGYSNWKVLQFIPVKSMQRATDAIGRFIFVSGIICLIISILVSLWLSGSFSKPIVELSRTIGRIGKGDFTPHFYIRREDELGHLISGVNDMAINLEKLMKDIADVQLKRKEAELRQKNAELKQKEAELKALQNQINPHFLYNTLETIQMKAIITKQAGIAEMVAALGKLFEYSMAKGSYFVRFEEELKNIDLYMKLQKIRYGEKFFYTKKVDEKFCNAYTLKFIIQPIIENSIYHGLENKPFNGEISLTGSIVNENVYIEISDNGAGISIDELDRIRYALKHSGDYDRKIMNIGIKNVNDRIKLFFGEPYGLDIDSSKDIGTCVKILLPYMTDTDRFETRT